MREIEINEPVKVLNFNGSLYVPIRKKYAKDLKVGDHVFVSLKILDLEKISGGKK